MANRSGFPRWRTASRRLASWHWPETRPVCANGETRHRPSSKARRQTTSSWDLILQTTQRTASNRVSLMTFQWHRPLLFCCNALRPCGMPSGFQPSPQAVKSLRAYYLLRGNSTHSTQSAQQFADWGIDYVKYDWRDWTLDKNKDGSYKVNRKKPQIKKVALTKRFHDNFRKLDRDIVLSLSPIHNKQEDTFVP